MTDAAPLNRILAFRLTTSDPEQLRRFYIDAIGCTATGSFPVPPVEMTLLGLAGTGARTVLTLGGQKIELDRFSTSGLPYPEGAAAADLVFQHFAIAVTDAAAAYQRALNRGATAISIGGPVKLPLAQGGVIAAKFRDPEGHPLEFLQFPSDGPSPWAQMALGRSGALGIDHSAISVADTDASACFYQTRGLRLGDRTLNEGQTQAALDNLDLPCVDVTPMLPATQAPHLELLGYRRPRGKPAPLSRPNDIAATRIVWASDRAALVRDPDGHLHQLEPQP